MFGCKYMHCRCCMAAESIHEVQWVTMAADQPGRLTQQENHKAGSITCMAVYDFRKKVGLKVSIT